MLYVALHFKAESYEESRSNTLIKICKRNGLLHSKYTSSFINKVCSFWKNYRSSGLGYKNFVVVWFNYISYLRVRGFQLFLYLFKIVNRFPSNMFRSPLSNQTIFYNFYPF